MKLVDWLLRLYPRAWRERYEEEFRAVLEQRRLTWFEVWDVVGGAWDARSSFKRGELTMETKRILLGVMGGGALLSAALLGAAVFIRPSGGGWVQTEPLLLGVLVMIIVSIALHLANRARDVRRSNQALALTAAVFGVGMAIFILLRQQPNGQLTMSWQGIYIGGSFGLWMALNARVGWRAGLLAGWLALLGTVAGAFWAILYTVWLGFNMAHDGAMSINVEWLVMFLGVALLWALAQVGWLVSLGVWVVGGQKLKAMSNEQ